ncbi:MAG TPA: DNA/RNA non-specific endonuclease [Opitutaceae bacterium]|nr:DNA/RNA non-specific endonuclease [Opitutaceae bacterium]
MSVSAFHWRAAAARHLRRSRSIAALVFGLFLVLESAAKLGIEYQAVLGNPTGAIADAANHDHFLIQRAQYAMDYNDNRRVPNWVSWNLSSSDYGNVSRSDKWAPDPDLPPSFTVVSTSTYNGGAVYDRGHMCPSADRTASNADNYAVFYMSNILPQASRNNQGLWNTFEAYCRTLASAGNEVLIICGAHTYVGGTVGPSGTAIPDHVWKIALVVPEGEGSALARIDASTRVIALDTPNTNTVGSAWSDYVTSVSNLEIATGYTFFSALPAGLAATLKAKVDGQVLTGAPVITTQPTDGTTTLGGSVTFSVVATGNAPLAYQWRKDSIAIDGAVAASLTIAPVSLADVGEYTAVVNNTVGATTSGAATLSVGGPPVVVSGPVSRTAAAGDDVTFSVVAAGTLPMTYEWFHGDESLGSSLSPSLHLPGVQSVTAGDYAVHITNAEGEYLSTTATLTVVPAAPTIVSDPSGQSVFAGAAVALSVTAKGTGPLAYQWRKNGVALIDGGLLSGVTTPTLNFAAVGLADRGDYDVVVTNLLPDGSIGRATSEPATVSVSVVPPTSTLRWTFGTSTTDEQDLPAGMPSDLGGGALAQGNNNGTTDLINTTSHSLGTPAGNGTYPGASGSNNAGAAAKTGALNTAAGGSTFFTFTLTPAARTKLSVQGISFGNRSTSTGPQAYAVYTSADGFISPIASGTFANNSKWLWHTPTVTSVSAPTGAPIEVRIYGFNGTGTAQAGVANWRIDDLTVVLGSVTAPVITSAPADRSAELGRAVVLSVVASGSEPLEYQWAKDGVALASGGDAATLEIAEVQPGDAGRYAVVVSNEAGSAASAPAVLQVVRTYGSWCDAFALTGDAAADTADPDGDGLPNLVEFFLGLAPTAGDAVGRPTLSLEGGHPVFRFTHAKIASGVAGQVEESTDLVNWAPTSVPAAVESETAATESLAYVFPSGSERLFVRLHVTRP